MALQILPVRNDILAYRFATTLEGTIFNFDFRFNRRFNRWFMDILDSTQSPIVVGTPLHTDSLLLQRFVDGRLPPGDFLMIDLSGKGRDADLDTFGQEVILVYEESVS